MPLDGRINVDVLFHDTDGTTALKVVSLEDSKAYTSGKVAIVTGTVGTAHVNLESALSGYRNASGDLVDPSQLILGATRVALRSSKLVAIQDDIGSGIIESVRNEVSVASLAVGRLGGSGLQLLDLDQGTASYTLVLYST